ncbi:MAG: N-acetylmuramoyl-L-alanine amidase, partial [Bacteroidales bacterium]|nr:N-acetylmuramoyl-L-alanine amidase [Bacteroidales bacterium]
YKQHYEGFDPNSAESYIIFEFMQDHNMAKSVDMAKQVQSNVCSLAARPNKGVKQAGFLVLRETSMPSCLIELGFISTPSEEQYLNNKTNIDNIARGIYNAFVAYKRKYDSNPTITYKKETAKAEVKETPKADKEVAKAEKETVKAEDKDSVTEVAPKETARVERSRAASTRSRAPEKVTAEVAEEKSDTSGRPVFKVQIMANDKVLPKNSSKLKGHTNAAYYKENGMVKYTLGESTNYNEILRLNKELTPEFPGCFIVAFKDGEKMNVNQAIREFLKKKK